MIVEVDHALEALLKEALGDDVAISFASPARVEAELDGKGGPVLSVHLLELREEEQMKSAGLERAHDANGKLVRVRPPRWYRLSYWLTAWAREPGAEHEALGSALSALAVHDAFPSDLLTGALEGGSPVRLEVAMPPATDAFAAGVWSSLRMPMKGAVHVGVLAAVGPPAGSETAEPVIDRQLTVKGPPPKRRPNMTPPPGIPGALMPPSATMPRPPGPPPPPGPPGPPPPPGPPGAPSRPPGLLPAPVGGPAMPPPPPEEEPEPQPETVEEWIFGPDPGTPPRDVPPDGGKGPQAA